MTETTIDTAGPGPEQGGSFASTDLAVCGYLRRPVGGR